MGLLSTIINAKDYVGVTPLFMLCERGYDKEPLAGSKPDEHKDRLAILKLLIPDRTSQQAQNL